MKLGKKLIGARNCILIHTLCDGRIQQKHIPEKFDRLIAEARTTTATTTAAAAAACATAATTGPSATTAGTASSTVIFSLG